MHARLRRRLLPGGVRGDADPYEHLHIYIYSCNEWEISAAVEVQKPRR